MFTFQIYGDFSGYSDIAIGTSRLFGFNLKQNFAFPYFSRDIAEFWRRWHISLSTWFRDYLYIPLGGSRGGTWKSIQNVCIIFIISGFWHGANWTFILWGVVNALYFLPLLLTKNNRKHRNIVAEGKIFPNVTESFKIVVTFLLVMFGWIIFRAKTAPLALNYMTNIFSKSLFSIPEIKPFSLFTLLILFLVIEWFGREGEHPIAKISLKTKQPLRWFIYLSICILIIIFQSNQEEFIYFQF